MTDHYATLDIPRDADAATVKRAYRKKASKAHPDKGGSAEQMALVNRAHDVLSDPARRERYDATGSDSDKAPADEAEELLMAAFDSALDQPEGEFMNAVRRKISGMASQGNATAAEIRAKVRKLEKRRAAIQCKGSRNVADIVIGHHLKQAEKNLRQVDHAIGIAEQALKMLEGYSSDETKAMDPWARYEATRFAFTSGA